eukprot:Rmarinus@m.3145
MVMEQGMNSIQHAKVAVCVRLRPMPEERQDRAKNIFQVQKNRPVLSIIHPDRDIEQEFGFDEVFDTNATQEDVFKSICEPLIEHSFEGFNGCCFAYGQTSSGKTYSIFGEGGDTRGLVPRTIESIFEKINKRRDARFDLSVSFLENYIDTIRDLGKPYLEKKKLEGDEHGKDKHASAISRGGSQRFRHTPQDKEKALEIHEDKEGQVYVEGLNQIPVTTPEEVEDIMNTGLQYRATYETRMNEVSSRSHTVFTCIIRRTDSDGEVRTGTLALVDLAGSERLKKSGSADQRKKEAVYINSSLSALGKVVMALNNPQSYQVVPYRDSKLTRILQRSIGGNSFTALVATLNPDDIHYDESLNTLVFAHNCRSIKNQPQVNYVDTSAGQQTRRLRKLLEEIVVLKDDLEREREINEQLRQNIRDGSGGGDIPSDSKAPPRRGSILDTGGVITGGPQHGGSRRGSLLAGGMRSRRGSRSVVHMGPPGSGGSAAAPVDPSGLSLGASIMLGKGIGISETGTLLLTPAAIKQMPGLAHVVEKFGIRDNRSGGGVNASMHVNVLVALQSLSEEAERQKTRKEEKKTHFTQLMGDLRNIEAKNRKMAHEQKILLKRLGDEYSEKQKEAEVQAAAKLKVHEEDLTEYIQHSQQQIAQMQAQITTLQELKKENAALRGKLKEASTVCAKEAEEEWLEKLREREEGARQEIANLTKKYDHLLGTQQAEITRLQSEVRNTSTQASNDEDRLRTEIEYLYTYVQRMNTLVRNLETGRYPVELRSGIKRFVVPDSDKPGPIDKDICRHVGYMIARLDRTVESGEKSVNAHHFDTLVTRPTTAASLDETIGSIGGDRAATWGGDRTATWDGGGGGAELSATSDPVVEQIVRERVAEARSKIEEEVLQELCNHQTVQYIESLEEERDALSKRLQFMHKRVQDLELSCRSVSTVIEKRRMEKFMAGNNSSGLCTVCQSVAGTLRPASTGTVRSVGLLPRPTSSASGVCIPPMGLYRTRPNSAEMGVKLVKSHSMFEGTLARPQTSGAQL